MDYLNEMGMVSVVCGRVGGIKESSNGDSGALIGSEHSGVKDVLEAFITQDNGETTVSTEEGVRTVSSNIFSIDQYFIERRGANRGFIRVRGVHGLANAERGDDSLLFATGGGHEVHAVCDGLGHLGVFAN